MAHILMQILEWFYRNIAVT